MNVLHTSGTIEKEQRLAQGESTEQKKSALMRPWIGEPPQTSPPEVEGYRLKSHQRFDIIQGSIAGLVLIPFWWIFYTVMVGLIGGPYLSEFTVTLSDFLIGIVIALILVPILHEAVHGLAAMAAGIRPSYGLGPGFAYTTFPDPVGKRTYLMVAMAPLIVLSLLGIPLAAVWEGATGAILFFLIVNAAGAIGDLWMSWRAIFQPRDSMFVDLADGFAVYVPESDPATSR